MYKIIIEGIDAEVSFSTFHTAVYFCEQEFGYEGEFWEEIRQSNDLYQLEDFLNGDGVFAEVIEHV